MGDIIKFDWMMKNEVMSSVTINKITHEIKCVDYTKNVLLQFFGRVPHTFDNLMEKLESRCLPQGRPDFKLYLEYLGLKDFNPLEVCLKTRGMKWEDYQWLRFEGDASTWESIGGRE